MSNVAGKAYALNVLTPMRPRLTWVNRLIFIASRALPEQLAGLMGLSIIHFARWFIIRRHQWPDLGQGPETLRNDCMMFCSNFNGTWDQYIDAFSDGLPNGLDLFWYASTRYPRSIPITPFKGYIRANQIDTDYYYSATPGAGQRDIKAALSVHQIVCDLAAAHASATPAAFAQAWREGLLQVQNQLGSPGFAPVASLDTTRADQHRQAFVTARWGLCAPDPLRP